MNTPSSKIDQIIKRIYSTYIDIKASEFDELKKDIMLEDIKNLYALVKDLSPNNYSLISDAHQEVIEKIKPKEIPLEISLDSSDETNTNDFIDEQKEANNTNKNELFSIESFNFDFEKSETPDNLIEAPKTIENKVFEEKVVAKETPKIEKPIFGQKAEKVGKEIYDFIDLNARIGLVEKFFKGNSIELSECLMKVNQKNTLNESVDLMNQYAQKYNISELDDIYQTFLDIINRKFQ
jgi:hypothetical protein